MELQELKDKWSDFDKKLDKSLQLNMQLIRKINFDKARFRMKWLFVIKIIEMCWLMFCTHYLISFTIKYFAYPQFSAPAIILGMITLGYFIFDIFQLSVMIQIQLKSDNEAIAPLQKKIETLKYMIVTYVKYSLFLIPMYPLLLLLFGKIFVNVDFSSTHHRAYLISNIIVGLCLLPLIIWVYKQLGKKELKAVWKKNVLIGSGWHLANDAEQFLNEIAKFEKED